MDCSNTAKMNCFNDISPPPPHYTHSVYTGCESNLPRKSSSSIAPVSTSIGVQASAEAEDRLMSVPEGAGNGLMSVPEGAGNGLMSVPEGAGNGLMSVPEGAGDGLVSVPEGAGDGLVSVPEGAGDGLVSVPEGAGR